MSPQRAIAVALLVLVWVAFEPVRHNGFVGFDDPAYVTENPLVLNGLSGEGFLWAWHPGHAANWHPLTWLSLMLDVSLWGPGPAALHRTSLAIHAANAVLLFFFLRQATGTIWRSAIVATVFAVHPLRVESVAWISERKDVLSTFFALLCLLAWVGWTRAGGRWRYLGTLLAYAASLAAKPMTVTLPFLLLLFDLWPLGRLPLPAVADTAGAAHARRPLSALFLEKVPFFALAAFSCVITLIAQQRGSAIVALGNLPVSARIENATWSYVVYASKAMWPADLAVFYPFPIEGIATVKVALAALFLLCGSGVAIFVLRSRPWVFVGWWWWVGALVPVIGLVQVGEQALADRYSYVPMIGLSIVVVWGAAELLAASRARRVVGGVAFAGVVCAWVLLTRAQTAVWKDDLTVFRHAAEVTERNPLAHTRIGIALLEQGRPEEAALQFELALRFAPLMHGAHNNLGVALIRSGRNAEAVRHFELAVAADPADGQARFHLGAALYTCGRIPEAIAALRGALSVQPDHPEARQMLERLLASGAKAPAR